MKVCPKCTLDKNLEEFSKNKSRKDGVNPWCKLCTNVTVRAWYERNKDKRNAQIREYQKAHPEIARASTRRYYRNHTEKAKAAANRCRTREQDRKYSATKRQNHPDRILARCAKRRAAKLQRTPPWLTKEHYKQMEAFYTEAKRLTKETGIKMVVDHIVPLQAKDVSGLHVPWNLQVITEFENCSKNNRLDIKKPLKLSS